MKTPLKTDKFASDMRSLDNLANVYANCENEEMKAMWKRKWYEMCKVIANRITTDDNLEVLN